MATLFGLPSAIEAEIQTRMVVDTPRSGIFRTTVSGWLWKVKVSWNEEVSDGMVIRITRRPAV